MRVALEILPVPDKGKVTVRFLGKPRGIITHFAKGAPSPCPGKDNCPNHTRSKWKGYAPAQVWSPEKRMWFPVVFEFTEVLIETIGMCDLRGKCWECWRQKTKFGGKSCTGQELASYPLENLPASFDVVASVQHMYGTEEIEWDIAPDIYLRPTEEVSAGEPPSNSVPEGNTDKPERIHPNLKNRLDRAKDTSNGRQI